MPPSHLLTELAAFILHADLTGKFSPRRPPTQSFLRATGPRNVHAERSLHFIPPADYEAMKAARKAIARQNWKQELGVGVVRSPRERGGKPSSLVVRSLDFEVKDASRLV